MHRPRLFAFFVLFFLCLGAALPQLLSPGRKLDLIETATFSIYYPPELAIEANRLASFAEEVLASEIDRVGPLPPGRIPVLLTDQFPETNGYYTPLPSSRIVLQLAPFLLDQETASLTDELKFVFAHELAHLLSMSSRPPLLGAASFFLGDFVQGSLLTGPSLLAEGTAIVAESSDRSAGRGRAWDPLSVSPVRQNLIENRRPSFWEATGATGAFPFGRSAYSWGGPFAAWLEEVYGRGALAKLYAELGALRLPEDGILRKGAFSVAFGRDLPLLWKDFLDSMAPDRPLVTTTKPLVAKPGSIGALTAGISAGRPTTIWVDSSRGAVLALATGDAQPRALFDADGHVNRLDLSPDGGLLLVSTAVEVDGFAKLLVKVWDLASGRFLPRTISDLREAAWAGDPGKSGEGSVVGIALWGMRTDLVLVEGGEGRVLLTGGATRFYGSPVWLSDGSIALLALDEGRSLLIRLDDKKLSVLASAQPLERLRFLSGRGDELVFGFAEARGLYKLALLRNAADPSQPLLLREEVEISGGVQDPALRSGVGEPLALSYIATFADGHYPADYPLGNPALALKESPASWVALNESFRRARAADQDSKARETAAIPAPPLPLALDPYRIPVLSTNLDAAGIILGGSDITESLAWTADAEYSWGAQAANLQASVDLARAPWKLGFAALDRFELKGQGKLYDRRTRADLSLSRFFPSFPSRRGLRLNAALAAGTLASISPGAAYASAPSSTNIGGRVGLGWVDSHAEIFPPFDQRGFEAGLSLDGEWRPGADSLPSLAAEAAFDAWLPLSGLHLRLDLAVAPMGGLLVGPAGRAFSDGSSSLLDPGFTTWQGFSGLGHGAWYARADLGLRLASVEIMRRIPIIGLYARRAVIMTGSRGGLMGALPPTGLEPLASLYAQASVELVPLFGMFSRSSLVLGLEVEYALLPSLPWRIGFIFGAGH